MADEQLYNALQRLRSNAQNIFDKVPVRDWAETLAEADTALESHRAKVSLDSRDEVPVITHQDQLALLKRWFPWLGEDEDQSGADTIDTLVEWHESVGGVHKGQFEADEDLDDDDDFDDDDFDDDADVEYDADDDDIGLRGC